MVREYYNREKPKKSQSTSTQNTSTAAKTEDVTDNEDKNNEFKVPKEKDLKLLQEHADLKLVKYDPDNDGFNFGIVEAFKVHKRTIFFNFIRKSLLSNQAKGFTDGADAFM